MGTFRRLTSTTNMHFAKIVGLLFALVYCIDADCLHPATAPNYSNEKYAGLWYEIGKIQTPGGAIFQRNCLCDTANVTSSEKTNPDANVVYGCRYNVIWLDQDTAIEYDCGKTLFIENYCIHFMSKTPSIAPEKLELMKQHADKLGLNTKGLKYVQVQQDGCW